MKIVLAALALVLVSACTKDKADDAANAVGCALEKSVVSLTTATLGDQLACKNIDAVKAAVQAEINKSNICKKPDVVTEDKGTMGTKGAIGDVVCQPIVDGMALGLLSKIPADWECTGGVPVEKLKATVLAACQKAL